MGFIRKQRLLIFVAFVGLLFWLVPTGIVLLDDTADELQNRCGKIDVPGDPRLTARPNYNGKVLIIRLTNLGSFVDRCELTDVLYELNWDHPPHPNEFRPDRKPDAKSLPKFAVLYIHGWKHDASTDDSDLAHFSKLIEQLAVANAQKKQVLGVYIGWNATSKIWPLNLPPFDNLTFWSKETIADRIAQSAVTTKIISSIGAVLSDSQAAANQFVAIGHSFGARLLFSATNQTLIYDTEKAHPGYPWGTYRPIQGMANSVILLNPAFEASRYTALDAVTRIEENFAPSSIAIAHLDFFRR